MKSILGIGVNTLDYTISTDGFPIEDKKSLGYKKCDFNPGGPVPNALVGLSRLGYKTSYVGNTSPDSEGDAIINSLKNEGVDVSEVTKTASEANKSFIISNIRNGTRTVLWRDIPKEDYFDKRQIPYGKICEADLIIIDGLERECSEEIVKFARAKNKRIIYGTESTSSAEKILPYVDVLVTPEELVKKLIGVDSSREDVMRALRKFPLEKAFVTSGKEGSYGIDFSNESILYNHSFDVKIMDSTGAGDAYLAGIALSSLEEKSVKDSLIVASAIATLNCLDLGGRKGLPNREQLKDFLKEHNLEGILR